MRFFIVLLGLFATSRAGADALLPTVHSGTRPLQACSPDFLAMRVVTDVWLADMCGGLFRSSDGGKHWGPVAKTEEPASQLSAGRLAGLMWLSEKEGLIVSGAGEVVRTTDGGRSWRQTRLPIKGPVTAGSRSGSRLWFCNAESQLVRSDDAGVAWEETAAASLQRRLRFGVLRRSRTWFRRSERRRATNLGKRGSWFGCGLGGKA